MNPFQKNKVDMSALSPEEQKAFRMYGKLPNRKDVLQNKLKERKYFDSGDYALSKAGKTSEISPTDVGREHPVPENIPHLSTSPSNSSDMQSRGSISDPSGPHVQTSRTSSTGGAGLVSAPGQGHAGGGSSFSSETLRAGQSASPVKEGSWLQRETSIDEEGVERTQGSAAGYGGEQGATSPRGVPIRGSRPEGAS